MRLTRVDPCPIILDWCPQPLVFLRSRRILGTGLLRQPIFEISDNFNFLKFSDFSILNTWQGNSINSVIFAFIARGNGGDNLQQQTLANIDFLSPAMNFGFGHLTHFDGACLKYFHPVETDRGGTSCVFAWEKLPKHRLGKKSA